MLRPLLGVRVHPGLLLRDECGPRLEPALGVVPRVLRRDPPVSQGGERCPGTVVPGAVAPGGPLPVVDAGGPAIRVGQNVHPVRTAVILLGHLGPNGDLPNTLAATMTGDRHSQAVHLTLPMLSTSITPVDPFLRGGDHPQPSPPLRRRCPAHHHATGSVPRHGQTWHARGTNDPAPHVTPQAQSVMPRPGARRPRPRRTSGKGGQAGALHLQVIGQGLPIHQGRGQRPVVLLHHQQCPTAQQHRVSAVVRAGVIPGRGRGRDQACQRQ